VSSNLITSLLGKLNAMLKKYQDQDILNLMRNAGNIKNELLNLVRNASRVCLRVPFSVVISGLIDVSRTRIFSNNCSSLIPLPCQQISMSSSQTRTHAENSLKLRVLEHSHSSIFFMQYVYQLFVLPVILTRAYNHSAWTFL
jgi:hypothetical protein